MKNRIGFVSNSSSSSFVIGYKDGLYKDLPPCPCCGRAVIRVDDAVRRRGDGYRTKINPCFIEKLDREIEWAKEHMVAEEDLTRTSPYQVEPSYLVKLEKAREIVCGWYDKYHDLTEVEVSDYDEETHAEIFAQEKRGLIEVLYWQDRNGDELRTKIYDL